MRDYFSSISLYSVHSSPSAPSLRSIIGLTDNTHMANPNTHSANPSSSGALQPQLEDSTALPFLLSSSLPPIPRKLVTKVHSLQFVKMKEFLHDNVLLGKRLDAMGATALLGPAWGSTAKPANMRDFPSLISWISCFTTYIAILGEAFPHLVRSHLAYMSLIITEASRNGGEGWRSYDTVFRQNAANNTDADWTRLDSSLHSSTFLAQRAESAGLFASQLITLGGIVPCAHSPLLLHLTPLQTLPAHLWLLVPALAISQSANVGTGVNVLVQIADTTTFALPAQRVPSRH